MDIDWELPEGELRQSVKYELYLSSYPTNEKLETYKKHADKFTKDGALCKFNLKKHPKYNILYGSVKFKQNIEEEWLVVYILYELSKLEKDLVIKVHDNDGDVLLIEAANHLPAWLESSKSENRVYIHDGDLHIIPESINLKDLCSKYGSSSTSDIQISQAAASFIRDMNRATASICDTTNKGDVSLNAASASKNMTSTLAEPAIQRAIKEQLSGLPDTKAWLMKKFKQLDEIISEKSSEDKMNLQKKFRESLTLASVMAMNDDELETSPISSECSSTSQSSSSSWLTEQQND